MPKRKKLPTEMTTEEIAKAVFPQKAVEELKKIAHEKDEKESNQPSQG